MDKTYAQCVKLINKNKDLENKLNNKINDKNWIGNNVSVIFEKKNSDNLNNIHKSEVKYNTFSDYDSLKNNKSRLPQKLNLNLCFSPDDISLLIKYNIPSYTEIKKDPKLISVINKKYNFYSKQKGALIKYKKDTSEITDLLIILKIYENIINNKFQSGGGKKKKDIGYTIKSDGKYGKLMIHLPGLFRDSVLIAYKNDDKVYDKKIDKDTLDLLTKRFNTKRQYSDLSKTVFNELTKLAELPENDSSLKFLLLKH